MNLKERIEAIYAEAERRMAQPGADFWEIKDDADREAEPLKLALEIEENRR